MGNTIDKTQPVSQPAANVNCDDYGPIQSYMSSHAPNGDFNPPPQAWDCYRKRYDLSKTPSVKFFLEGGFFGNREIKKIEELRKHPNTLLPLQLVYEHLVVEPDKDLHFIIDEIRKRTGKPVNVLLPRNFFSGRLGGQFYLWNEMVRMSLHRDKAEPAACSSRVRGFIAGRVPVHHQFTDCKRGVSWSIGLNRVFHELGHNLMYVLYRKRWPGLILVPHDNPGKPLRDHKTSPAAAWTEGFANAAESLGNGMRYDISLAPDASKKTIEERISNEWVIGSVLTKFMRSTFKNSRGRSYVGFDIEKFKKIIACMERAGMQHSFREFVVDYIHDFPEEKATLMGLLRDYRVVVNEKDAEEFLSAANYVERSLKKFVDELDALSSNYDRFITNRAKIKRWKQLESSGAREILLSRSVPITQRMAFREFVETEIRKVDPNTRPKRMLPLLPW